MVALPAVDVPKRPLKLVLPPDPPLTIPPSFVMVALPAVELLPNAVPPPSPPLTVAALLVKIPSAAVAVPSKSVLPLVPLTWLLTVPPLLMKVPLAAVALPLNSCGATPERLTGSRRAVVGKSATARARDVIESNKAGARLEVCATVRRKEGAAPCCRTVIE